MTIQDAIRRIIWFNDLSQTEAASAMHDLMSGQATPAQVGAFLAGMSMKGRTIDEITGFAETMRFFATRVETHRRPLVDTCGTGGDHSGTFNISTTAAFVVAGAGVAVAKHGNRSATSKCGSADVLEHLGVEINLAPERVGRSIDQTGIGFLFARALHSAMKHVAAARSELGIPTIFNILGPLTNPAGAEGQIIGVFDAALTEPLARVLMNLGSKHVFVVAGCDGLDEITLTGPTRVSEGVLDSVRTYEIEPGQFGLKNAPLDLLKGGDSAVNGRMLRTVLQGEPGPRRDIVLLNAAPAIVAGGAASCIADGIQKAAQSIDSGAALNKLEALRAFSRDMTPSQHG